VVDCAGLFVLQSSFCAYPECSRLCRFRHMFTSDFVVTYIAEHVSMVRLLTAGPANPDLHPYPVPSLL
jgi:hypothetical protein